MKKLLFLLLALGLAASLPACRTADTVYDGPTGSPQPGYPHGDQGDEDSW